MRALALTVAVITINKTGGAIRQSSFHESKGLRILNQISQYYVGARQIGISGNLTYTGDESSAANRGLTVQHFEEKRGNHTAISAPPLRK